MNVDLPKRLAIVHQPHRLRIMGLMWRRRDVSYRAARDALGLTDGNLAAHAQRLIDAGLLESRRALAGDRFEVRYRITQEGITTFRAYLQALHRFLQDVE